MNWQLSTAKNGEQTLSLNGVQIYSSYRPREDARRWVEAEFDATKSSYLLIGLGLGYHAERLIELAGDKTVSVYYFDLFERTQAPLIQAIETIDHLDFSDCQILIPNAWVKAIGQHPLLPFLEDIKINQQSYKRFSNMMTINFEQNKLHADRSITYPNYDHSVVCLVASGPSLNETIEWLKACKHKVTIFVVGSALKILLKNGIEPDAVFIADAQDNIIHQLKDAHYTGDLFYLSTAYSKAVSEHNGPKYMIFQEGYAPAEQLAAQWDMPLLQTGGSVSTVAISFAAFLGVKKIILFGQDLGFHGDRTHADASTSGRNITMEPNLREVEANDGSTIYTTANLQIYARWISQKASQLTAKIYTTSAKGYRMDNVPFIDAEILHNVIE